MSWLTNTIYSLFGISLVRVTIIVSCSLLPLLHEVLRNRKLFGPSSTYMHNYTTFELPPDLKALRYMRMRTQAHRHGTVQLIHLRFCLQHIEFSGTLGPKHFFKEECVVRT